MFDRLDAIKPIMPARFGHAPGGDEDGRQPLLDERPPPRQGGGRGDQRDGERRSGERRRKERRASERRSDDRRGGSRVAAERRQTDRRATDRRDGDRRRRDRRLPGTPVINFRQSGMPSLGWGRSRRPVVDDYA